MTQATEELNRIQLERRIAYLEAENRRIWSTRLCWRDGARMCDTDKGPQSRCPNPATGVIIGDRHDTTYVCGQSCIRYLLAYNGRQVREIARTRDGFFVMEYADSEPKEQP